jgi:outer membrane protein assembly factor BamB
VADNKLYYSEELEVIPGPDSPMQDFVEPALRPSSLRALDSKTQKELWEHSFDFNVRNPVTVSGNTVYAVGQNHLAALSAENGALRWSLDITDTLLGLNFSDPIVDNGVVYITQNDIRLDDTGCRVDCQAHVREYYDYLLTLDAATGVINKRVELSHGPIDRIFGYQNRIYYAQDRHIYATDLQTSQTYEVFAGKDYVVGGITIGAAGLVFGTSNGEIYCLNMQN